MRKIIIKITTVLGIVGAVMGCIGCGKNDDVIEKTNLALILGNVNNNPVFDCSINEVAMLSKCANAPYSIICADGEPNLILEGTIPNFENQRLTQTMLERVQKGVQTDINTKISEAAPDNAETDIASAIELGVRAIKEKEADGMPATMVICHNGISTSGEINMIETPIANMDVDKSVETLVNSLNIDMKGINVIFYYLADVRGSQTKLNSQEKAKLEQFYSKLLMGLGADSVVFKDKLALSETYNFPEQVVSCMPTGENKSLLLETVQAKDIDSLENVENVFNEKKAITFNETDIEFKPESAEFLDENMARQSITYVIDYIKKNKKYDILICGTCAGDDGGDVNIGYDLALSQSRADAVKQIICDELGINGESIKTKGLGSSGPFYVAGMGLGPEASVNRNVTFLLADSAQAKDILNNY